jgi:hypothetical protein
MSKPSVVSQFGPYSEFCNSSSLPAEFSDSLVNVYIKSYLLSIRSTRGAKSLS